ncbi:MAG: cysteine--tRNA ligase [Thermoanaerobaculia bacterium]|nr:cysteine--tRNA ligase [Thermoanaerobaculia bacterium]
MSPRPVRFYNSLGRRLEPFEPLAAGRVGLYTCGPTVYNHAHIGNLRTFLFEDLLKRALRRLGFDVLHVMNLTDVDDKTIRGASERGVTLDEFTAPYIESFHADLRRLGVDPADHYPRATQCIAEMQAIVARLLERGFAYESDGSVWFRIATDPDYGKLSGVDLSAARQGERVAGDEYEKEDVRDFVLWKGAKPGEPAWATWASPWGPGRPGWHIECSAMSAIYLGETFDIHCGGVDNMFPHHENEIAQSESASGKTFVRYWLHAEHLVVDGQKMSKSLGNQYTLQDLLDKGLWARAIRHALISVHYRQKLNFTIEGVHAAERSLRRIDEMRFRLHHAKAAGESRQDVAAAVESAEEQFASALADDLNISGALAAVFELVRAANIAIDAGLGEGDVERIEKMLASMDSVVGTLRIEEWRVTEWASGVTVRPEPAVSVATGSVGRVIVSGPEGAESSSSMNAVQSLVDARDAARARRDFKEADRLRDELAAQRIVLEDTPQGTRWKRAR